MTRRLLTLVLLLIYPARLLVPAHADAAADARAAIQSALDHGDDAFVHKNIDGVLVNIAPDYVDVGEGKAYTLADERKVLTALFLVAKDLTAKTTITDFAMLGHDAQVTTDSVSSIVLLDTKTLGDVRHTIHSTNRDFWVHKDGLWLEKRSRTLTHEETETPLVADTDTGAAASLVGKLAASVPDAHGKLGQWTMVFGADGTASQTIYYADGEMMTAQLTYTAKDHVLSQTVIKGTLNGQAAQGNNIKRYINYKVSGDTLSLSLPSFRLPITLTRVKE